MSDITEGIRDYLASGGLFNPEMMDHQRVRDLVIECRDEIERLSKKVDQLTDEKRQAIDLMQAEIERLRGDLAAMNDSVAVAAQALNDEERENERLQELLREAIDADRDHYATAMAVLMAGRWHKRVREALGE